MKKRVLALLLFCAVCIGLVSPALAAEAVTPTPPAWCRAEEYAVFPDSQAYETDTWEKILSLREFAAAGNLEPVSGVNTVEFNRLRELSRSKDPGVRFELGLLAVKFALNAAAQGKSVGGSTEFEMAAYYAPGQEDARYLCYLWNARMALASKDLTAGLEGRGMPLFVGAVGYLLGDPRFDFAAIYDSDLGRTASAEQLAAARAIIYVTLDGEVVHPRAVRIRADYTDTSTAQVRNQRTMVPVRRLAELMGAVVSYDGTTRQVTLQRAGDTVVMTLDSADALQNGVPFQMDVAPYAENGRTYIPIRYIAEFFGQKVEWRGTQQQVVITEDKSAAGGSNLEAWTLAMGALVNEENNADETRLFGGKSRFGTDPVGSEVSNRLQTTGPDFGRTTLSRGWGITGREELMSTAAALAAGTDAWDWFRTGSLAQWGYLSGYVTYPEALALAEPAARRIQGAYSNWDGAVEAYLKGWMAWAGETGDVWQTARGQCYQALRAEGGLFDDTLFQTGVIGLPG